MYKTKKDSLSSCDLLLFLLCVPFIRVGFTGDFGDFGDIATHLLISEHRFGALVQLVPTIG